MNENLKIIAEFVDKASAGIKNVTSLMGEFAKGMKEGAAAELKLIEAEKEHEKQLKKTAGPMDEMVGKLKTLALAFVSVKVVVDGFVDAIKEADKLDDLSDKTGISASSLKDLGYAAKIGGSSLEGLVSAFDKLGRNADRSEEETSKQAKTFAQLGVDAKDANGNLKSSEQLFNDLADAFKNIKDGPEKSAAAFRLFGGEAKNLLPLLNRGSEGIAALKKESQELGNVAPGAFDSFAKASGDLFDNIDKVKTVFSGFFTNLSAELVPVLNIIIEQFVNSAKEGGLLRDVLNGIQAVFSNVLIPAIKVAAVIFDAFTTTVKIAGKGIGAFFALIGAVASGDFAGAKAIVNAYGEDVAQAANEHVAFANKMALAGHEAVKLATDLDKPKKQITSITKATKETKSALAEMVEQLKIAAQSGGNESAKQLMEAQLKYRQDIKKGLNPAVEKQLLAEAAAWILLAQNVKKAAAEQEAYQAVRDDLANYADETALLQYEATLVGKSADERARLTQAYKDNIEVRKQVAKLGDTDVVNVANDIRNAQAVRAEAKKASEDAKISADIFDASLGQLQENFTKRVTIALKLYEDGKITIDDFTKYQQAQYDILLNYSKKTADETTVFWQEAAKNVQNAFADFFFDAMQGKLSDLVGNFKKAIDKMVANALAAKLASALFGGSFEKTGELGGAAGSGLAWLSTLFGGFRATGGTVEAGKIYAINENTPNSELWMPESNGTVIPDASAIGMGGGTNINLTVQTIDAKSFVSHLGTVDRELTKMVANGRQKYNIK